MEIICISYVLSFNFFFLRSLGIRIEEPQYISICFNNFSFNNKILNDRFSNIPSKRGVTTVSLGVKSFGMSCGFLSKIVLIVISFISFQFT